MTFSFLFKLIPHFTYTKRGFMGASKTYNLARQSSVIKIRVENNIILEEYIAIMKSLFEIKKEVEK